MNRQAIHQILMRTRDELLAMAHQLRGRAQEIQFQIDHVAPEQSNGLYYYHSDGSDGYSDTESDQSDLMLYVTESDYTDTDDGYPMGPEFENSGSGETMSDGTMSSFETSTDDDTDDNNSNDYGDVDYDSELNQLDVTVMSSTSLSDFSDF